MMAAAPCVTVCCSASCDEARLAIDALRLDPGNPAPAGPELCTGVRSACRPDSAKLRAFFDGVATDARRPPT